MAKSKTIELMPLHIEHATVSIKGTSDLILNRMNARTTRLLVAEREDKAVVKEAPNKWEDVITAIRWRDGYGMEDTYKESTEEKLYKMLEENCPCISAFGFKKSLLATIVRSEIEQYSTKLDNCVQMVSNGGNIPIEFTDYFIQEFLASPKKGSPILCRLSHFCGWSSDVTFSYDPSVYSIDFLVDIIRRAGHGQGIGSSRSSGYGRYEVTGVR